MCMFFGCRKEEGRTKGAVAVYVCVFERPSSSKTNDHSSNARSRAKAIVVRRSHNDNANETPKQSRVCPALLEVGIFPDFPGSYRQHMPGQRRQALEEMCVQHCRHQANRCRNAGNLHTWFVSQ